MDDNQLNDLKQFITTTVSQQLADTEQRLKDEIGELRQEVRQGFAGISEAI